MKKRKKKKIETPEELAFKIIEGIYNQLAAKMVVALYKEKDRAVKKLAKKYKI